MANWEYIHEYIKASSVSEEKLFGVGTPKEVASKYPTRDIQLHLNHRGSDGWSLIKMEPDWHYERVYISLAMSISRPLAIVGWFLTFSKQHDAALGQRDLDNHVAKKEEVDNRPAKKKQFSQPPTSAGLYDKLRADPNAKIPSQQPAKPSDSIGDEKRKDQDAEPVGDEDDGAGRYRVGVSVFPTLDDRYGSYTISDQISGSARLIGIESGDYLLEVDGESIRDMSRRQVEQKLGRRGQNETVKLLINRLHVENVWQKTGMSRTGSIEKEFVVKSDVEE